MEGEAGKCVSFDKVLFVDNDGKVEVGAPTVKGKILAPIESAKVIIL